MWSINLQQQLVREIGRYVSMCNLLPPLWIGITFATSQSEGNAAAWSDTVKILCKNGASWAAYHFRNALETLSGPGVFFCVNVHEQVQYTWLIDNNSRHLWIRCKRNVTWAGRACEHRLEMGVESISNSVCVMCERSCNFNLQCWVFRFGQIAPEFLRLIVHEGCQSIREKVISRLF